MSSTLSSLSVAAAASLFILCSDAKVMNTEGCGKQFPIGTSTRYLSIDDPLAGLLQRSYNVYVPKNYDPLIPTPIVYDFHGYYGQAEEQEEETGFKRIAEEYYFIVVWPQGLDDTVLPFQQAYSWNARGVTSSPGRAGPTCNWTDSPSNFYPCHKSCRTYRGCRSLVTAQGCDCGTCANDELYVIKMMDDMEKTFCVSTPRVYATGMSMGAMMVYTLAATQGIGQRFQAIAPTAGSNLVGFNDPPVKPMPVMDIHGTKDDVIPSNVSNGYGQGPEGSAISEDGYYYKTTTDVLKLYADANACKGNANQYVTEYDGDTDLYCWNQYGQCPGSLQVVRCSHSLGHTWPFVDSTEGREQYAKLVWAFFAQSSNVDIYSNQKQISREE